MPAVSESSVSVALWRSTAAISSADDPSRLIIFLSSASIKDTSGGPCLGVAIPVYWNWDAKEAVQYVE
jgi:hypothetical protein